MDWDDMDAGEQEHLMLKVRVAMLESYVGVLFHAIGHDDALVGALARPVTAKAAGVLSLEALRASRAEAAANYLGQDTTKVPKP